MPEAGDQLDGADVDPYRAMAISLARSAYGIRLPAPAQTTRFHRWAMALRCVGSFDSHSP